MNYYRLIYADPPWNYKNEHSGRGMHPQDYHYERMTTDDIAAMPISTIANKNAALFLWGTVPMINDAFRVMAAWGFEYKTMLFWQKIMSQGMGFWFRGQVEICLLGIRGNIPAFHIQKKNWFSEKVRGHSVKPETIFEYMDATGLTPRIELFARSKRDGWHSWGNEVDPDINFLLPDLILNK